MEQVVFEPPFATPLNTALSRSVDLTSLITAELVLEFRDSKTAEAIDKALSPDNVGIPCGMKIKQIRRGPVLKILVSVDEAKSSLERLVSTSDEFLAHIRSAAAALTAATGQDKRAEQFRTARALS